MYCFAHFAMISLQVLSGSSDGDIKLWSVGEQCCVQTYKVHTEGVWTLLTNDSFTQVYSSGRDRRVWLTDLRHHESHALVCEESAPVLKVSVKAKLYNLEHIVTLVFAYFITHSSSSVAFCQFIYSRRSGQVCMCALVCRQLESHPDASSLWVATANSTINNWVCLLYFYLCNNV